MALDNRQQTTDNSKSAKVERSYPIVIASAFIFNEKNELLLIKAPRWLNKYTCVGGKVEIGETIIQAVKREVKEETNLNIDNIKLFAIVDGLGLEGRNDFNYKHLIFINHTAICSNDKKIKLDKESESYLWLPVEKWLEKNEREFAPYIFDNLKRLNDAKDEESLEHKYKRALADYQNLLKRTAKEKEEFAEYANEGFIIEILPVYDNLKISLAHIDEAARSNGWAEGIMHIVKQFKDVLSNLGVTEIEVMGKNFDPQTMEAIEGEGGKVSKVVKPGYRLNGKVIVPAKVILSN